MRFNQLSYPEEVSTTNSETSNENGKIPKELSGKRDKHNGQ